MPRGLSFPRASRGDSLYRVEWSKGKPQIAEYTVITGAASSVVVTNAAGKEQILVGKVILSHFDVTPEGAVAKDFRRIAFEVSKMGADAMKALQQVRMLSDLV